MTQQGLAIVSLCGCTLDVMGAMYLAYDLLGGQHGPLRTMTRAVTYSLLFGLGFGLPLGPAFGIAAGLTNGISIGLELSRAARGVPHFPYRIELLLSFIRALGYTVGAASIYGWHFGAWFGLLSLLGQAIVYRRGIRPELDYSADAKPRITKAQGLAAIQRTGGYAIAGYVAAAVAHHQMHALSFGLEAGLVIGIVTALSHVITPYVEWLSSNMPARRMGVLGVWLLFAGFGLQSVQYWMTLLGVPLH